jgi:hypothetical protein
MESKTMALRLFQHKYMLINKVFRILPYDVKIQVNAKCKQVYEVLNQVSLQTEISTMYLVMYHELDYHGPQPISRSASVQCLLDDEVFISDNTASSGNPELSIEPYEYLDALAREDIKGRPSWRYVPVRLEIPEGQDRILALYPSGYPLFVGDNNTIYASLLLECVFYEETRYFPESRLEGTNLWRLFEYEVHDEWVMVTKKPGCTYQQIQDVLRILFPDAKYVGAWVLYNLLDYDFP